MKETAVAIVILILAVFVWRRIRNAMTVAKSRRESPRYMAHIQSCPVCFRDDGPYPFQPCPEGLAIVREETLGQIGP